MVWIFVKPEFEYLSVLALVLLVPLVLSFHPKNYLKGDIKKALLSVTLVSIPWLIWDIWATQRGHWAFNYNYNLGIKIINLPFEEYLFFLVVPYACLFLWATFRDFEDLKKFLQRLKLRK